MAEIQIDTARAFVPLLKPARYKGAYGGRWSGKSHFFGELCVDDALRFPGDFGEGLRMACIREVQKDLAQSSKALIEKKLAKFGLTEADGFKVFKDCIQTPGDGLIIFKGMNDYTADSIKSLEGFQRAWWEEAHTATANSLKLLTPTLRATGSELWFSWNPRFKTDPVDVMFRGEETPTGAIVVQANWRENPWRNAECEQERLDCFRMYPDQYPNIWEGEYVTVAAGAYFAKHLTQARLDGRITGVPIDPLMSIRVFCDLGGTGARADAFSMWVAQFVGKEIRVIDYYEAQGQPLGAHVEWLRGSGYGKAHIWLPHDGETNDRVHDVSFESAFRAAGFSVTVIPNQGKGAAKQRIEAARRRFPAIWFDEKRTEPGRAALGWYHEKRDEERGIGLGPEHDWSSHAADAFGLMCISYQEPQAMKPINYPSLGIA